MKKIVCSLMVLLALSACSSGGKPPTGVKVGKPYTIDGQTYYPEYDPHYDKTGMASWYGPGFHGKPTATGEQYDQHALTAAHPTLPMPSMVRVTNLATGKSAVVRVNDRGPFKDNRIIDLSKASAEALGITGLAKVRVQYLKAETESYWANMNLKTNDIQFAKNDPYAPQDDEDGPGKYDGTVVAKDETSPQVRSSAPITSVASTDITPENLKVRPIQPRFRVISEAEAAEPKKPAKVVQLVDGSGKPVGKPLKAEEEASEPEETESADESVSIDTSSEAVVTSEDSDETPSSASSPFKHAEPVKTSTKHAADSAPAAGGSWFIQAGSFSSSANAEKLAKSLKALGKVDTRKVEVKGKPWYRVRLGPFTSRDIADKKLAQAQDKGANGATVVKE